MDVRASNAGRPIAIAGVLLPALLAIDVVFGGSVRGQPVIIAALEMSACLALAWCLFDSELEPIRPSAWWLLGIVAFAASICLLQIVPLPYAWWNGLPGRGPVSTAFKAMGLGEGSQPLSLDPERTLYGVLKLAPSVAMFVLAAKLPRKLQGNRLGWMVVALAAASVLFALVQMLAKDLALLFPYGPDSRSRSTGLFQASSHQATLQLMAIPFIAALFARVKTQLELGEEYRGQALVLIAVLALAILGVILSGSIAGYAMAAPVIGCSCALLFSAKPSPLFISAGLAVGVGLAVFAYLVITSPWFSGFGIADLGDGPLSRQEMYRGSFQMARDYWPLGTGLGAFEHAYGSYENPATITASFIDHAHSDYLEVAAELGAPGCLAVLGVVIWWCVLTVRVWQAESGESRYLKRAASIAVGVVLVQSLVDYPTRTQAISCLAALCMGLMSSGLGSMRQEAYAGGHVAFRHKHIEI